MPIRVLVVDDDFDIRMLAAETLRAAGFDVTEAQDASSAVAVMGENPAIEVLFTDIEMPGIDGFSLAVMAVLLSARVHVLYTSGRARLDDCRREHTIPGEMLAKPYSQRSLVVAVRNACVTALGVRGGDALPLARPIPGHCTQSDRRAVNNMRSRRRVSVYPAEERHWSAAMVSRQNTPLSIPDIADFGYP